MAQAVVQEALQHTAWQAAQRHEKNVPSELEARPPWKIVSGWRRRSTKLPRPTNGAGKRRRGRVWGPAAKDEASCSLATDIMEWGGGGTASAWNIVERGRDSAPVDNAMGVVVRGNGAVADKAQGINVEVSYGVMPRAMEWSGCYASVASSPVATVWYGAPSECLAALAGTKPVEIGHYQAQGAASSL